MNKKTFLVTVIIISCLLGSFMPSIGSASEQDEYIKESISSSNFNSYLASDASQGIFPVAEIPAAAWGKTGTGGTLTAPQNPNNSTTAFGIASAGTAYAQYNTPRVAIPIGEGEKFSLEFDFCSERGGYAMVMNPSTGWGCWSVPFFIPQKTGTETTCTVKYLDKQWDIQSATERAAYLKNTGLTYTYGTWAHMKIWCDQFNGTTSASVLNYQITPYGGTASNVASGSILYNRGLEGGVLNLTNISQIGAVLLKPDSGAYSVVIDNVEISRFNVIPRILDVTFEKYDGAPLHKDDLIPPIIKGIKVSFNTKIKESSVAGRISITDGNSAEIPFTTEVVIANQSSLLIIKPSNVFELDETYKLSINKELCSVKDILMKEDSEYTFKTSKESMFRILPLELTKNGQPITASAISNNDVIHVKAVVLKTGDGTRKIKLNCCMFSRFEDSNVNMLAQLDSRYIDISQDDKGELVYEYDIPVNNDLPLSQIKAFLWEYPTQNVLAVTVTD